MTPLVPLQEEHFVPFRTEFIAVRFLDATMLCRALRYKCFWQRLHTSAYPSAVVSHQAFRESSLRTSGQDRKPAQAGEAAER